MSVRLALREARVQPEILMGRILTSAIVVVALGFLTGTIIRAKARTA